MFNILGLGPQARAREMLLRREHILLLMMIGRRFELISVHDIYLSTNQKFMVLDSSKDVSHHIQFLDVRVDHSLAVFLLYFLNHYFVCYKIRQKVF